MVRPLSVIWWATSFAWAALIFHLSTQSFSSDLTEGWLAWAFSLLHLHISWVAFDLLHALLRKLAHLAEYAIFALFLYGPPGEKGERFWRPRRALIAVLGAAVFSLTDEFHQLFVPGRNASLFDCGLDTLGASLAMLIPYSREQLPSFRSNRTPT